MPTIPPGVALVSGMVVFAGLVVTWWVYAVSRAGGVGR